MDTLLEWLEYVEESEDSRQRGKVRHRLKDILVIVLLATLANADDWVEIGIFAQYHEAFLRKYIRLENGIPSHDTIQRVMALISPDLMQQIMARWHEVLNSEEGEKLKKIIAIDGKTMRGNTQNGSKPSHIVSAYCDEDGFCLGKQRDNRNSGAFGQDQRQGSGYHDRRYGNADSHRGKDTSKTRGLCTGLEREPGNAA